MIEKIVLDYLTSKLDVPCSMELLPDLGDSFVVIEKTGSTEDDGIEGGTIAIQSYGASLLDAAKLNEKVKLAMKGIVELDSVYKCKRNSDYNFTDPTTKRYRYQAVFNINY